MQDCKTPEALVDSINTRMVPRLIKQNEGKIPACQLDLNKTPAIFIGKGTCFRRVTQSLLVTSLNSNMSPPSLSLGFPPYVLMRDWVIRGMSDYRNEVPRGR